MCGPGWEPPLQHRETELTFLMTPVFMMGMNSQLSKDMGEKQFPFSTGFKGYEGRGNSVVLESPLRISNLVLPGKPTHWEGVQCKACRHHEFCFTTGVSYHETFKKKSHQRRCLFQPIVTDTCKGYLYPVRYSLSYSLAEGYEVVKYWVFAPK